jgi:hypothetical protein
MKPKIIAKSVHLSVFTVAFCLTSSSSWARPPQAQVVCGAVQIVDRQTHLLTLVPAGNETPLRLAWAAGARLVRNGNFGSPEALKAGARVRVHYRSPFFGKPFVTKVVWQEQASPFQY